MFHCMCWWHIWVFMGPLLLVLGGQSESRQIRAAQFSQHGVHDPGSNDFIYDIAIVIHSHEISNWIYRNILTGIKEWMSKFPSIGVAPYEHNVAVFRCGDPERVVHFSEKKTPAFVMDPIRAEEVVRPTNFKDCIAKAVLVIFPHGNQQPGKIMIYISNCDDQIDMHSVELKARIVGQNITGYVICPQSGKDFNRQAEVRRRYSDVFQHVYFWTDDGRDVQNLMNEFRHNFFTRIDNDHCKYDDGVVGAAICNWSNDYRRCETVLHSHLNTSNRPWEPNAQSDLKCAPVKRTRINCDGSQCTCSPAHFEVVKPCPDICDQRADEELESSNPQCAGFGKQTRECRVKPCQTTSTHIQTAWWTTTTSTTTQMTDIWTWTSYWPVWTSSWPTWSAFPTSEASTIWRPDVVTTPDRLTSEQIIYSESSTKRAATTTKDPIVDQLGLQTSIIVLLFATILLVIVLVAIFLSMIFNQMKRSRDNKIVEAA